MTEYIIVSVITCFIVKTVDMTIMLLIYCGSQEPFSSMETSSNYACFWDVGILLLIYIDLLLIHIVLVSTAETKRPYWENMKNLTCLKFQAFTYWSSPHKSCGIFLWSLAVFWKVGYITHWERLKLGYGGEGGRRNLSGDVASDAIVDAFCSFT